MRKVIFWDKTFVVIKDEQEPAVVAHKAKGKPFYLNHAGGRDYIEPGAIARITSAKSTDYHVPTPDPSKLLAAPEISDEQREANLDKIAKIKADLKDRIERKQNGQQRSSRAAGSASKRRG